MGAAEVWWHPHLAPSGAAADARAWPARPVANRPAARATRPRRRHHPTVGGRDVGHRPDHDYHRRGPSRRLRRRRSRLGRMRRHRRIGQEVLLARSKPRPARSRARAAALIRGVEMAMVKLRDAAPTAAALPPRARRGLPRLCLCRSRCRACHQPAWWHTAGQGHRRVRQADDACAAEGAQRPGAAYPLPDQEDSRHPEANLLPAVLLAHANAAQSPGSQPNPRTHPCLQRRSGRLHCPCVPIFRSFSVAVIPLLEPRPP